MINLLFSDVIDNTKLKDDILKLAFNLEEYYPNLLFKHHCYLRIAYDNTIEDKWNKVIISPFLSNCSQEHLTHVLSLLVLYTDSKKWLLAHNQNSLKYRKK